MNASHNIRHDYSCHLELSSYRPIHPPSPSYLLNILMHSLRLVLAGKGPPPFLQP